VVSAGDIGSLVGGIGGGVVVILGVVVGLKRLFGAPSKSFNGETKEILSVLREIRDRLVASGYEQRALHDCSVRIEQSQQALHKRFDDVITRGAE
jgi:hypothetical protein